MQLQILKEYCAPLTEKAATHCKNEILAIYRREQEQLPFDHAWRLGKLEHAESTMKKIGGWCVLHELSPELVRLIELASFSHDLGRFPQAVRQASGEKVEPTDHGRFSIELLCHLEPLFGTSWSIFAEAIEKHSLRQTPARDTFGSPESWALCCVVRDFDKAQGFDHAGDYTSNRENKIRQARANKLRYSEACPTAESGSVDTLPGHPDILGVFLSGTTITRAHCASYEAYMLQYLAWLYDFNVPEVRDMVIVDGGPKIVLAYLRNQLGVRSDPYQKIAVQADKAWGLRL